MQRLPTHNLVFELFVTSMHAHALPALLFPIFSKMFFALVLLWFCGFYCCELINHRKVRKCLILATHSSNTVVEFFSNIIIMPSRSFGFPPTQHPLQFSASVHGHCLCELMSGEPGQLVTSVPNTICMAMQLYSMLR